GKGSVRVLVSKAGNLGVEVLFFCLSETYAVHFASYLVNVLQEVWSVFPVQSFEFRQSRLDTLKLSRVCLYLLGVISECVRNVLNRDSCCFDLFCDGLEPGIVLCGVADRPFTLGDCGEYGSFGFVETLVSSRRGFEQFSGIG